MRILFLDFESFYSNEFTLKKMTPTEYICDERWETLGCAVIEGITGEPQWFEGDTVADWLRQQDLSDVAICCHNTPFDGSILSLRYDIHPAFYFDTLAMARAQVSHLTNGRVSLAAVAKHYDLPEKGKALPKMMGMTLAVIKENGLYQDLIDYALHDVHLCREIFKRLMPGFPDGELKIIDELVHMVTQPMFAINTALLRQHLEEVRARKAELLDKIPYSKLELMSNDKFAEALKEVGAAPPRKVSLTTGEETWAFAKTDKEFQALEEHEDERVQALVAARLGHKSTLAETRAERFIAIAEATEKHLGFTAMPVPLRYSGAHTHRFSGDWSLNLQNLPSRGDTTLRNSLVAPDGYTVVTCDSAQVEARLTAWLAKQAGLVQQFADDEDVYSSFASKIYGYTVTKKNKLERFLGKTCILGLGFGMGHAKFKETVRVQAAAQGFDLPMNEDDAKRIVWLYRSTYANIAQAWRDLDERLNILANKDKPVNFGPVSFEVNPTPAIVLPSGLRIHYHNLRRENGDLMYGTARKVYGGKALENIVQALDRIVVVDAMMRIKERLKHLDIRSAHNVHDEGVWVVPDECVDVVKAVALEEMCRRPAWGPDLPLGAEAASGKSFGACK